ncbi:MAG: tetratricopeptide repeat protein, partial [Gemmataceae bacterium]|nr:tetratricopeptide repeat protein [Gemmataceae bacterium]
LRIADCGLRIEESKDRPANPQSEIHNPQFAGRPYFVMELVKGVPITKYCDEHRLTPRQRLELFVPVCQAVQHAHQKGIIHRDLKPSNVLVATYDDPLPSGGEGRLRGVPKVIDFGVAKATGTPLTEQSLDTGFGAVVGTVEYMSPEQASIDPLDVDTRSDIYSLGVLLYELLTGSPPFCGAELETAGLLETLRVIREQDPPKPSTKLSAADGLPALAANRGTEPTRLPSLVRGELDWIVMKCLEKDRDRRYETANALGLDIQRYLNDEPVLAGPPAAGYRLRKFVRRHRGAVLSAALVLFALLAGLAGTTWGLVRAEQAWQETEAARLSEAGARHREAKRAESEAIQRKRAEDNEKRANEARDRAEEEKQIADAARRFLQVDLLRQADPRVQADTLWLTGGDFQVQENPTIRELLDRAAAELTEDKIEAKFPKQPRLQAEILQTLGTTYQGIGDYEKAVAHFIRAKDRSSRAFGPRHALTLAAHNNLALAYRRAGKNAEAIAINEELRSIRSNELGPTHPDTLITLHNLAVAYREFGKTEKAIALFEEVRNVRLIEPGPNHPDTLSTLNNLAVAYRNARRTPDAVDLLEKVRGARVATQGPTHPDTLATLDSLAGIYRETGKTLEAIELYKNVYKARSATHGMDHPDTLTSSNNLATAYWRAKRLDLSVPLFEQTLRLSELKPGPDHPLTLVTMANLGINYRDAGKQADGVAKLAEAYQRAKKRTGSMPAKLAWIPRALADAYDRDRQFAKSEPLYKELADQARIDYGEDAPQLTGSLNRFGLNLIRQHKGVAAVKVLNESMDICKNHGPKTWWAFETRALLGGALLVQKNYVEAEPLLREGYQGMKAKEAELPPTSRALMREALHWLIELAEAEGNKEAAEKWRKERKAIAQ